MEITPHPLALARTTRHFLCVWDLHLCRLLRVPTQFWALGRTRKQLFPCLLTVYDTARKGSQPANRLCLIQSSVSPLMAFEYLRCARDPGQGLVVPVPLLGTPPFPAEGLAQTQFLRLSFSGHGASCWSGGSPCVPDPGLCRLYPQTVYHITRLTSGYLLILAPASRGHLGHQWQTCTVAKIVI